MESQPSQSTLKAPVFRWNVELVSKFVDLLVGRQLRYGKKQRVKWREIAADFTGKCGKPCTKVALRSKFEAMKRDYKAWITLKLSETSLGWDTVTGKIDATDEWWERKIKEDVICIKFRNKGMNPVYAEMLVRLFEGQVATGQLSFSPSMNPACLSQHYATPPPAAEQGGGKGLRGGDIFRNYVGTVNSEAGDFSSDSRPSQSQPHVATPDETPIHSAPNNPHPLKRMRRQSVESSESSVGSSKIEEHLAHIISNSERMMALLEQEISSKPTRLDPQLIYYMDILDGMVSSGHIAEGGKEYLFASSIAAEYNYRQLFLAMRTSEQRVNWLRFEMKQRNMHM